MISAIKNNRSLTFYQTPLKRTNDYDAESAMQQTYRTTAMPVCVVAEKTGLLTRSYNEQLCRYLNTCKQQQQVLTDQTNTYMSDKLANNPTATNAKLRDKNTWKYVKRLVTREELMKLQISKKCDFPISESDKEQLYSRIKDLDLSKMDNKEIQTIIDDLIRPDQQEFLDALKQFKATGKADTSIIQSQKLDTLTDALKDIDLDKITGPQYKKLEDNYREKPEFHHRTSISNDPSQQSVADNVEPLKTSEHDAKHTDAKTGKVNYQKPVNEKPVNRQGDMQNGNKKRVCSNELRGLGVAVAIAAGIGLTIGFVTTLARAGVSPESIKVAAINGAKSGAEASAMAAVGYGIGRTLGEKATQTILNNIGISATTDISKMANMVNMGVVGVLTISVFSIYQFTKLKIQGIATKEALVQVGKQAVVSLSILALSIVVQGVYGGAAGMIVSTGIGLILVTYSVADSVHQRRFAEQIREYTIEKYTPYFA